MSVDIQIEEQGTLHVRATGKLAPADYEEFVPVVDQLIAEHGKARILFEMHDFHGWTAGAIWSDLAFGIKHFSSIDRLALVAEKAWQRGLAHFCRPFTRARIHTFRPEEIEAAWKWLREGLDRTTGNRVLEFQGAPEQVAQLLQTLAGDDGLERERARHELVKMGSAVTDYLVHAAQEGHDQLRLEATQALSAIGEPALAEVLAGQFEDTFEIGWAAAEGLKTLGRQGALATLNRLLQHPSSPVVRMSAHHALRHIQPPEIRQAVGPVVAALADTAPGEEAPVAALSALEKLRQGGRVSER